MTGSRKNKKQIYCYCHSRVYLPEVLNMSTLGVLEINTMNVPKELSTQHFTLVTPYNIYFKRQ